MATHSLQKKYPNAERLFAYTHAENCKKIKFYTKGVAMVIV